MAYEINEQKKIGLGLIGFGIFFTFLGALLLFDRGLLALGNIFWLSGVAILLGWRSTWKLFTNRANYKGSVCFLLGLFFIFVRWPVVGIIFEIYSCIALFGGFWPSVKVFLYQIPVVGWIIQYPITGLCLKRLLRSDSVIQACSDYVSLLVLFQEINPAVVLHTIQAVTTPCHGCMPLCP
ncbi:hypothetical protein POTOM_047132 [Populus tomentosa]|uniref:Vesicle transport protein GOT1B n=1 Tax=Populus tomentosa TaxID=118781 RepID=A0A8X8CEI7_POPTO|nr:hypothetical protein POTOM_047132 [Populus tomentosa]